MDTFDFELDTVKVEKANAMLRYRRLRNIAKLFRVVEVFVGLVFLSWTTTRLPFAVKISGEYFRLFIGIIINPLFIFLLGNVIVLTLLLKSGQFSGQSPGTINMQTDLYDEFMKDGEDRMPHTSPPVPNPEEIKYQDKQVICEVTTPIAPSTGGNDVPAVGHAVPKAKALQRSKSENLETESLKEHCSKLRRSETEICQKVEIRAESVYPVDELSSEEFQRAIEAFIAKQVKFHQEEKSAIVLHSHA